LTSKQLDDPTRPDLTEPVHTQYHAQDVFGNYKFGYDTGDGSFRTEERHVDQGVVRGQYGYVGPEGRYLRFYYIADANGYRVSEQPLESELDGKALNINGVDERTLIGNSLMSPAERRVGETDVSVDGENTSSDVRAGQIDRTISVGNSSVTTNTTERDLSSYSTPEMTVPAVSRSYFADSPLSRIVPRVEIYENKPNKYFSYVFMHPVGNAATRIDLKNKMGKESGGAAPLEANSVDAQRNPSYSVGGDARLDESNLTSEELMC